MGKFSLSFKIVWGSPISFSLKTFISKEKIFGSKTAIPEKFQAPVNCSFLVWGLKLVTKLF